VINVTGDAPRVHRIGLIGAGDVVRRFWSKTLAARDDVWVVGVCSAGGRTAENVAALHGSDILASHEDLIAHPDVDTVLVVSPPHTHLDIAATALQAGKQVLIEKPLCANLADARALLAEGRAAPGVFGVTFNNRLRENNAWVRDQALAGAVGEPRAIRLKWWRTKGLPGEAWRADPNRAFGGVLADLGSHLLSMGLAAVPARRRFTASCRLSVHRGDDPRLDHRADADVVINDFCRINLSAAWGAALEKPVDFAFDVTGTLGQLSASNYPGASGDGYSAVLDNFLSDVARSHQPDLNLFEDVMIVLDALYRAADLGRPVEGQFVAGERPDEAGI